MDLHALTRLGQDTDYPDDYEPGLLQPLPREDGRIVIGVDPERLPFHGLDLWTHYELSWLDAGGKPVVAVGEILVPADSPCLIESKSLKLYFNSLNFMRFDTPQAFSDQVEEDLTAAAGARVTLTLREPEALMPVALPGQCLDDLPLVTDVYHPDPGLLKIIPGETTNETWHSHLLRTNCPVTDQPDWASVVIHYAGPRIDPESLLAYLVSFRRHSDFHEQCVERIFHDLGTFCGAELLTVYARYTRRGGLDINPFRSNAESLPASWRTVRQ